MRANSDAEGPAPPRRGPRGSETPPPPPPPPAVLYDCSNCPSYCCSYAQIEVEPADIRRLARHFGLDLATAERRFTKDGDDPGTRVMRHIRDPIFGTVCRLLDLETRTCTAYSARPQCCRDHPFTPTCHYYDFLRAERRLQNRPDLAVRAFNVV